MPRLQFEYTRHRLPRLQDAKPVRRRPIEAPRQADRAWGLFFGPRFDVPLVLHAAERDVHGAALERAVRLLDQLETEHLLVGKQLQNQMLSR